MPWNGTGTFTRNYSWVQDAANGIDITASRMDADTNDITSNGLGNALTRDGQGIATANLPMGAFRHTGVGNGVARTDYAALGQVQDGVASNGGTSTGASGVFAIALSPAITAYKPQIYSFTTHQAAAGADTLNINGVGALPLVKGAGTAIAANDFASSATLFVFYSPASGGRFFILSAVLLGSPQFTGTPTVPTPAVTDNSTTIVNSAWVRLYAPTFNASMAAAAASLAALGAALTPGM
jgi:hypothetical protein